MRKKLYFFFSGALLFLFFIAFSYLVHKNLFSYSDFNTTVRLQDHIPRKFDGIFSFLSLIGSFEPMIIILIVVLVILRKIRGIVAILGFGLFHLFELYGKFFVAHRPPPHFMLRTEQIGNFPQFYIEASNSYPSGHAGRTAFLSILIGIFVLRSKKLSQTKKMFICSALAIYDLVMFASRIYLGEHWLSDVVGGAILGYSLGLLSLAIY